LKQNAKPPVPADFMPKFTAPDPKQKQAGIKAKLLGLVGLFSAAAARRAAIARGECPAELNLDPSAAAQPAALTQQQNPPQTMLNGNNR
jgi:hypothetical protein